MSGIGTRSFGQDHKDRLKKIGRMAGIPVALMADDVNAPHKVLAIVDHIAGRAGITKLSRFEGTEGRKVKDTDKLSVNNLTSGNGHKKSMEAIQEWR
ncbi:hypothetical protein KA013_04600 [Patescibacteria group bacterium]|nr:hypothetical protein [Patescibacteria group bacterium]